MARSVGHVRARARRWRWILVAVVILLLWNQPARARPALSPDGGSGNLSGDGAPAEPLGDEHVLLIVNAESPASVHIADLYRQYHPGITSEQVVMLTGLADAAATDATPADEIISRDEFSTKIAQPIREHLINYDLVNQIYVIITTAGLPYRIEDTTYPNVVHPAGQSPYPWGSNPSDVVEHIGQIDAASVESELAVLFQTTDPQVPEEHRLALSNRVCNPYQGYRSGIRSFASLRDIRNRAQTFQWDTPWAVADAPWMEGQVSPNGNGMVNRRFSPADIYLTARLDGPRGSGVSPIFAVRQMLERARKASDPSEGVNPNLGVIVLDDSPVPPAAYNIDRNRAWNLPWGFNYLLNPPYEEPPDTMWANVRNDYGECFEVLTAQSPPSEGQQLSEQSVVLDDLAVIYDFTDEIMNAGSAIVDGAPCLALATFGRNAGDGRPADYLFTGGPEGGALFQYVNGAVFASLESFNATTMFIDVNTTQGKIADFVALGGTAAMGHAFEPGSEAAIDVEFVFYNLLADEDEDGRADLTAVEAFFTGLPFLSWSEVFIGDPLMRLAFNEQGGGIAPPENGPGDANGDGFVDFDDLLILADSFFLGLGSPGYDDRADFDKNLFVDYDDLLILSDHFFTYVGP